MKRPKIWYDSGNKEVRERSDTYSMISHGIFNIHHGFCTHITGRDLTDYPKVLHRINPRFQYVEVGAGLGGFIPYLLSRQNPDSPKPVVVDPADYKLLFEMLIFSLEVEDFSWNHDKIRELSERCKLIMDPNKVRLINLDVREAIQKNKSLEGIADVVVDNYGARTHYGLESNYDFIKRLLKKGRRPKKRIIGNIDYNYVYD